MLEIVFTVFIIFMILLLLAALYFLIAIQVKKRNDQAIQHKKENIMKIFYELEQGRAGEITEDLEILKRCFKTKNGFAAFYSAYQSYTHNRKTSSKFKDLVNDLVDYESLYNNKTINESYRLSYILYMLSEFGTASERVDDFALESLEHESIYVRINALKVIQVQSKIPLVIKALEIISGKEMYFNNRVVVDFLDSFEGSKKDLDHALIDHMDGFKDQVKYLILDHFINQACDSDLVKDFMLQGLSNASSVETKLKSTRYFSKVHDERALPLIRDNIRAKDWSLRAISAQSISSYDDKTAIALLKESVGDSNFFVRKNSAISLLKLVGKEEFFEEAMNNEDAFARDVLNYLIESDDMIGFDYYKTLKDLNSEKEKLALLLKKGGLKHGY